MNIQNLHYNFSQNQQVIAPKQHNMSHNKHFYFNANLGYGNEYHNKSGCFANYDYNQNYKSNFQPINGFINNRDNGFLTANYIYLKKQDLEFNLNLCYVKSLGVNEAKPRIIDDPFSNLICFKNSLQF